jgi:hypothetical protein
VLVVGQEDGKTVVGRESLPLSFNEIREQGGGTYRRRYPEQTSSATSEDNVAAIIPRATAPFRHWAQVHRRSSADINDFQVVAGEETNLLTVW